jgi:hypothetical protein
MSDTQQPKLGERWDIVYPMGSDCVIVRSELPVLELLGAELLEMLKERSAYWQSRVRTP